MRVSPGRKIFLSVRRALPGENRKDRRASYRAGSLETLRAEIERDGVDMNFKAFKEFYLERVVDGKEIAYYFMALLIALILLPLFFCGLVFKK